MDLVNLNEILTEYRLKLKLNHWEIELHLSPQDEIKKVIKEKKPDNGYYGCCTYDYDTCTAKIYIDKTIDDEQSIITLKHELVHILFCELKLCKKLGNKEERLINTLVNAM